MKKDNDTDYEFKPNFCDEVITALRNPKKNIPGIVTDKRQLEFYKRIITKSIVGSQKFILDREMIKHAVKTSFCKPFPFLFFLHCSIRKTLSVSQRQSHYLELLFRIQFLILDIAP